MKKIINRDGLAIILVVLLAISIIGAFADGYDNGVAATSEPDDLIRLGDIGKAGVYRFRDGDTICYVVLGGVAPAVDCVGE